MQPVSRRATRTISISLVILSKKVFIRLLSESSSDQSLTDLKQRRMAWADLLRQPWENSSSYAVQEHEAQLDALDYRGLHAPWDRNEVELVRPRTTELMSSSVQNNKQQPYKYIPLHQPVELTPAQIKKMKDHKTMAPFRTEDNYDPLSDPTLLRKCVTPQPRTLAPYLQGREAPSLNSSKRIVGATRNTALWNVSSGENFKNKEKEESSGDPVLDKLKAQLKLFGASGILGLSRKFRIMVGFSLFNSKIRRSPFT